MRYFVNLAAAVGGLASTSGLVFAQVPPPTPVPAPGALALFAVGALALWVVKRSGDK